jgi:hypothetical protein
MVLCACKLYIDMHMPLISLKKSVVTARSIYNHGLLSITVRNPTPEGRGLVRSRPAVSEAHLTRLSLETSYVRSETRYVGVRGQPQPLREQVKQVYKG